MQRSLSHLLEGLTMTVILALVTVVSRWVITTAPEVAQAFATATPTAVHISANPHTPTPTNLSLIHI